MEKEEYRGLLEQLKELGYTENLDEKSLANPNTLTNIQQWLIKEKGITVAGLFFFFAEDDSNVSYLIRRNGRIVYTSHKRWSGERRGEAFWEGIYKATKLLLNEGK